MDKKVKILAIIGQAIFIWVSLGVFFCPNGSCFPKNTVAMAILAIFFVIFDLKFLKYYLRFEAINRNILNLIAVIFPLFLYLLVIALSALVQSVLGIFIAGAALILLSALIWFLLFKVRMSTLLVESGILKSFFILAFGITYSIININLAIISYKLYKSPDNDIYIIDNNGKGNSFINYKLP